MAIDELWKLNERPPVELSEHPQTVTRQQLTDPAFFAQVKDRLLAGEVHVIDQATDHVMIGGQPVPANDDRALHALGQQQDAWISGQP